MRDAEGQEVDDVEQERDFSSAVEEPAVAAAGQAALGAVAGAAVAVAEDEGEEEGEEEEASSVVTYKFQELDEDGGLNCDEHGCGRWGDG